MFLKTYSYTLLVAIIDKMLKDWYMYVSLSLSLSLSLCELEKKLVS